MADQIFPPKAHIARRAHVASFEQYKHLHANSVRDFRMFWRERGKRLEWFHPFECVCRQDATKAYASWYLGGKLNASFNCVDRHLEHRGAQTAIVWVGDEPGVYRHISYQELHENVCRMANALREHGVRKGDRVCIYLPMIPETAFAMLACARIGAVHSVVYAGFSAESLRDRIVDARCRVVLTANEGLRGGKTIPLKKTVDAAIAGLPIESVLVKHHTRAEVPMQEGRDFDMDIEVRKQRACCPAEWMDSEDPLFVLYTAGSTGKPKGQVHTTGGYLVYASYTHETVFDWHPGDMHFCAADLGWIAGHTYTLYGPLCNGAATVLFESTPVYPDASRYWQIVDDLQVSILYTTPAALRTLMRHGDAPVRRFRRESLRVLGSLGEPLHPDVWRWYHDVVGEGRCAVIDTWWQTESGGVLLSPLPGGTACKPGSVAFPLPGIGVAIVDENGKVLEGNDVAGSLCIAGPWPAQARTIFNDHERYIETYLAPCPGLFVTGDGCRRDKDGYYWITGRVDDVLNVSGRRIGTAEIEQALVEHELCAEAAVVGFPHDLKGQGIHAYVIASAAGEHADPAALAKALREHVRAAIGPIATLDRVQLVPGLPRTRSGEVMRRILRQVAAGSYGELGDITTLAEPHVVEQIVEGHKAY